MKWILILAPFAVGLVAAIGFVVIVGACISRTHSATRSVRLAAAPEAVWGVITDFPNHPLWRPGLRSVEPLPPRNGHPVWIERSSGMGGDVLPIEIEVFEPPRRMVGRIADDSLPFGGTWTYDISAEGDGCRVRITEDGFIKPAVFRYIARTMGYSATLEKYLRSLAKKFGAEARIEV